MQRLKVWLLAGQEGIDEVVGLFRLRPGVSRLRRLDQDCGICRIIRAAVGNVVASDFLALGRAIDGISAVRSQLVGSMPPLAAIYLIEQAGLEALRSRLMRSTIIWKSSP